MRNHISFRVRDGDTFGLGFDGNDPDSVQKVTARLANALILENSRHRAEAAEGTREFLDAEMEAVRRGVERAGDVAGALFGQASGGSTASSSRAAPACAFPKAALRPIRPTRS